MILMRDCVQRKDVLVSCGTYEVIVQDIVK